MMSKKENPSDQFIQWIFIVALAFCSLYAIADITGLINSTSQEKPSQTQSNDLRSPNRTQAGNRKKNGLTDEEIQRIKDQLNPDQLIGIWEEEPEALIAIYTSGNTYYYSNSAGGKLKMSEGYELLVEQRNERTVYILDMFQNPTNLEPGVKLVNE